MSELIDGNIEMQVYRGAWTTSYHKLMFNRGRLMNTMFKMIDKRQRTDLFIFHDPCLMLESESPEDFVNMYAKPGTSYGCSKTGYANRRGCDTKERTASAIVAGGVVSADSSTHCQSITTSVISEASSWSRSISSSG